MTRRKAREFIMQMLFESDFHEDSDIDELFNQRIQEIEDPQGKDFIIREYQGIIKHQDEINEIIQKYSQNWNIKRIAKVDLMILKLAVYELLWENEIPKKGVVARIIVILFECSPGTNPAIIPAITPRKQKKIILSPLFVQSDVCVLCFLSRLLQNYFFQESLLLDNILLHCFHHKE